MKLDSPLFDRVRVKRAEEPRAEPGCPRCAWPGCERPGAHRAPKGRQREGEYWRFCLDHVREYNSNYNYFAGMSDEAVMRFQKDALTGHRPTWKMGVNGRSGPDAGEGSGPDLAGAADPLGLFNELGGRARPRAAPSPEPESRMIRNAERKALDTLGLEIDATGPDIKARFKVLVKRHHPDANGGDRTCEDRLREVIQAYNYLKSVNFC